MSAYRKTIQTTMTVDGQAHTVTVRPMTYAEAMEVTDAGAAAGADKERSRSLRLLKSRELIANAIVGVNPPVLDADGVEVTTKELCEALYFQEAISTVIGEWVTRSQVANPS